jgi:hypothetical protein
MMARDVFAIQAAGVGVEREFSIAGMFNGDNKSYSDKVLGALMVCNHAQSEENRADKFDYYSIHCRMTPVLLDELPDERDDQVLQLNSLVRTLDYLDISDGEDDLVDEDGFVNLSNEDEDDLFVPAPPIGLPRLPSFTSPCPSSVRSDDDDGMEVDLPPQTPSRFTRSSELSSGNTASSLLSSPMSRLSASSTSVDVGPVTGIAGRLGIARGGGRRSSSRLASVRLSVNNTTPNAALVNGRPAQKRLRASTIQSQ